jgi:hypothetical protein
MRMIVFGSCILIGLSLSLSSCTVDAPLDQPAPPDGWSPPTQIRTPDGIRVSLDGRFRSSLVGRRNADGSISSDCHDSSPSSASMLRSATPTTTAPIATATRSEAQ